MYGKSTWQAWRLLRTRWALTGRVAHDSPQLTRLFLKPSPPQSQKWIPRAAIATASSTENHFHKSQLSNSFATKEAQERIQELQASNIPLFPRFQPSLQKRSVRWLYEQAENITSGHALGLLDGVVEVSGRISSIRLSGARLAFIDIVEDQKKLQIKLDLSALEMAGKSEQEFKDYCRLLRRGDHISVKGGEPYKARNGQLSIPAVTLPTIQSPCLQRLPIEQRGSATTEAAESNYQPRHVEMLSDPEIIETLRTRSTLIKTMRLFFENRSFVEVSTPILSALAGGATAKPFETTATEFSERRLSMRIAPELWLKRLIIGGMDKIFEIGPSFRNEGLDKTHNPEFTTCEFYAVGHNLPQLINLTEELLTSIATMIDPSFHTSERMPVLQSITGSFKTLDFIPALNSALGVELPNLSSPEAHSSLLSIFQSKDIRLPSNPTLPRLVDELSSIFLEPQSLDKPLWITNIPESLSPLAKSFIHPTAPNEQPVAARAELFIQGREVVNCYEEENSPSEQRRKFVEQQQYARLASTDSSHAGKVVEDEEAMKVDEDYLQALEWGLPPTGGWGCGIDRLVMLFAGKERIGDVLSFGNLRAVTRGAERMHGEKERVSDSSSRAA